MREILFRGKRADTGEWVEGYYVKGATRHCIFRDLSRYPHYDVIPETVGQYTGLTDKNGKKIFEGDILSERPPMNNVAFIGRVIYSDENSAFEIVFDTGRSFVLGAYSKSYTIVGNIHDNPEFLEVHNG